LKSLSFVATSLLALGWATAVHAQDTGQAAEPAPEANEDVLSAPGTIVVTGARIRGQLIVDQPPVAEYDSEDIAAFGGSSIADIIAAIEPATGSARGGRGSGRPVFLINGIRVSSFREFRSYPPESIAKIEVFAEEVAQRFGYSPDQRVVNIVLQESYSSVTAEVEAEAPARGGYWRNEQEVGYLSINDGARINLNLEVEDVSLLTEDERDLVTPSAIPGVADEAPFRSLVSDSYGVEATANYAKAFIDNGSSISLNLTGSREESLGLSGLRQVDGVLEPIERRNRTDTLSTAASYTKPVGDFQLTATFDGGRTKTRSEVDRSAAAGYDISRSTTWNATNLVTLRGIAVEIPAGEIATTFDVGYDWQRIESDDTRTAFDTQLTRGDLSGGVNIVVPLTSRRTGFLDAIGDISVSGQAGVNHLSDFGTLQDWSLGVNWSPFENLNLQATRIWREVAPGLSALGSPRIDEANVSVFDFATGQDVLATVITGGNPDLREETSDTWTAGVVLQPSFLPRLTATVDYYHIKIDNYISTPGTANIIAACYGTASNGWTPYDSSYCSALPRNADSYAIEGAENLLSNTGGLKTEGVDFEVNYSLPLNFGVFGAKSGKLSFRVAGTRLIRFDLNPVAAIPDLNQSCAGKFGIIIGQRGIDHRQLMGVGANRL